MEKILSNFIVILLLLTTLVFAADSTEISLPKDQLPHNAKYEWWYYNGLLKGDDGKRYGFHLLFKSLERGKFINAEFSLCDMNNRIFEFKNSLPSQKVTIRTDSYSLSYGQWMVEDTKEGVILRADTANYKIELMAENNRVASLHGNKGLFPFGEGGASFYYSIAGIQAKGSITDAKGTKSFKGVLWHDHQWGESDISTMKGWYWLSVYLPGGEAVMIGERLDDNGKIIQAEGSLISSAGVVTRVFSINDMENSELGIWTSAVNKKIVYPVRRSVTIKKIDLDMIVEPVIEEAEITGNSNYWEGPVSARGYYKRELFTSDGYQELVKSN